MAIISKVTMDALEEINLTPDLETEITQNVAVLMATHKGDVPLDRGLGTPKYYRDMPQNIAVRQFEAEMSMGLRAFETRADMLDAAAVMTDDGTYYITAEVEYNDGTDE